MRCGVLIKVTKDLNDDPILAENHGPFRAPPPAYLATRQNAAFPEIEPATHGERYLGADWPEFCHSRPLNPLSWGLWRIVWAGCTRLRPRQHSPVDPRLTCQQIGPSLPSAVNCYYVLLGWENEKHPIAPAATTQSC